MANREENMKKILILIALLLWAFGAHAQIEKGDTEVGLMGYFASFVGGDNEANGVGSVQLSYGKYLTPNFQFGVAPVLTFYTGEDESGDPTLETDFSGAIFMNFNFSTASRFIPYITGRYFQYTFDIPEGEEFTDYSYVTVGIGFKNFFNEYAAFDTLLSYGFSLREEAEGGLLQLRAGLTFIF